MTFQNPIQKKCPEILPSKKVFQKRDYLSGRPLKHIASLALFVSISILMTFTANIATLLFVGHYGGEVYYAAMGYASQITMIAYVFGISSSSGVAILFSRKLGSEDSDGVQKIVFMGLLFVGSIGLFPTLVLNLDLPYFLKLIGAKGEVLDLAVQYLRISLLFNIALSFIFLLQAYFRALGYIKESLYLTISSALPMFFLVPLLTDYFHFGIQGAAFGVSLSYLLSSLVGFYYLFFRFRLFSFASLNEFKPFLKEAFHFTIPAIISSLIQILPGILLLWSIQDLTINDKAAVSLISQILPWTFVGMIAVYGSATPVLSQAVGAKNYERFKIAYQDTFRYVLLYGTFATILYFLIGLFVSHGLFKGIINLNIETRTILWHCILATIPSGFAMGLSVVVSVGLNTLGYPARATFLNMIRMVFFVSPLAYLAKEYGHASWISAASNSLSMLFTALLMLLFFKLTLKHMKKLFTPKEL